MAEDFYSCIKLGTLKDDTSSAALSNEAGQGFLDKFIEKYSKATLNLPEQVGPESTGSDTVLLLCETPHVPKIELYPGDMYHLPGIIIDGKRM